MYGIETLCELMLAILDDLDLRDWQIRHNLETLAERAGLATRSDGGHKSISRASRGCDRLSWLNAIITEKAPFNPYDARCACKHIEVTEEFFAILGIPLKQAYRERARLLEADPNEVIFVGRYSPDCHQSRELDPQSRRRFIANESQARRSSPA